MTKKQTKCNSDEGKGVDGVALDDAGLLTPAVSEMVAHLADASGLVLSVMQDGDEYTHTLTDRRTGMDLISSNRMTRLHEYVIAYSQGRDAGIAESIRKGIM